MTNPPFSSVDFQAITMFLTEHICVHPPTSLSLLLVLINLGSGYHGVFGCRQVLTCLCFGANS